MNNKATEVCKITFGKYAYTLQYTFPPQFSKLLNDFCSCHL